jgi:hypothetical protein
MTAPTDQLTLLQDLDRRFGDRWPFTTRAPLRPSPQRS